VNCLALQAFNPGPMTGAGNWTWLVPGRAPTLIDAGVGDPRHLDAIEEALGGALLEQVVVTHGHSDHASGAPAIAARFPEARFLKIAWPDRDARWPVAWEPVGDGGLVAAGDARLLALHTPGHAPDHLCLWHEETRTLFGGDLVQKGATVWIPAGADGDLAAYLASLERVRALRPARILPAHGPAIEDPPALIDRYLAHRRERDGQILDALRAGAADPQAIAARVYRGLRPEVAPRARETVVAHLLKLEREGLVGRRGDAWHIMDA
jgi:glyoxylase-like metal-dependent hydrolase (beta-lactamase superfamily II)